MGKINCVFVFVYGKGLDDLNKRLQSNPKFVFMIHKRKKGKKGYQWAIWRHKQTKTRAGDVRLIQKDGVFWGEINDRSGGYMLAGSFLSWIMSNADDLVYRIDFWRP